MYARHGEQRYTLSKVPVYKNKCYVSKASPGQVHVYTCIYLYTVSMVLPVLLSTEGRSQYIVSKGAPCWYNARANTAMHMYLT